MPRPWITRARRLTTTMAALGGVVLAARADAQAPATVTATDSLARRRIQALPALGSAPETGWQFGAAVLAVWEPPTALNTRPSSLTASAMRTAKGQTRVRADAERWTRGNARRIAGMVQWQEFPLPYFGIGAETPESAEEIFTPRGIEASVVLQQRVREHWFVTGGARHVDQRIRLDTGGALRGSSVTGRTGGTITEWSAGVLHDTRENLFAPRRGRLVQLSYARSIDGVWSDFGYGTMRLDARDYRAVRGEHVLATHLQVTQVDGAAPFDQLALVGGSDILRGYARGRYRDQAMAALQAEYRSPVRRRLGAVAFAGAGVVGAGLDALPSGSLLPTYGAGVRVTIDARQRTGLRADYGRGKAGASGLYLGFNSAF
jgi:Omp85 superfamily domain